MTWTSIFQTITYCFNTGLSFLYNFTVGGVSALYLFFAMIIMTIILAHFIPAAGNGLNLK